MSKYSCYPFVAFDHRKRSKSQNKMNYVYTKVEKNEEDSLDLIPSPSPSVKIQIVGRKVYLRCQGKTLLGVVNKHSKTNSLST